MTIGFIGCGNMAKAIIGGISSANKNEKIIVSDSYLSACEIAKEKFGVEIAKDNIEVAQKADVLFLAVKPQFYSDVIAEISSEVDSKTIVVSIAPGKTLEFLQKEFGKELKIVRTMPNTPAMVMEGMTAMCVNEFVLEDEVEYIKTLLQSFGKCEIVAEYMIDAVVAVSGSSPAYVYMFIEALADGAVKEGLPRDKAYTFAAQAVLGSAKMVLESGLHPGALKDMVCSPRGTTIEAVKVLEQSGFRGAVMSATEICAEKSRNM